ncbi:MAG: hypothetical protein M1561_02960 [Gammaproteobacteria bacterium]|nr:hypothetical protein [Gammaproteobacteria bacterium]
MTPGPQAIRIMESKDSKHTTLVLPISIYQDMLVEIKKSEAALKHYLFHWDKLKLYDVMFAEAVQAGYRKVRVIITDTLQRFSPYFRADHKMSEAEAEECAAKVGKVLQSVFEEKCAFFAADKTNDLKISFEYWQQPRGQFFDQKTYASRYPLFGQMVDYSVAEYLAGKYKGDEKKLAAAFSADLVLEECAVLLDWIQEAAATDGYLDIAYLGISNKAIHYVSENYLHFLPNIRCQVNIKDFLANCYVAPAFRKQREAKIDFVYPAFGEHAYIARDNFPDYFDRILYAFCFYDRNLESLLKLYNLYFKFSLREILGHPGFTDIYYQERIRSDSWFLHIIEQDPTPEENLRNHFYLNLAQGYVVTRSTDGRNVRRLQIKDNPALAHLLYNKRLSEVQNDLQLQRQILDALKNYVIREKVINAHLSSGIVLEAIAAATVNEVDDTKFTSTCYDEAEAKLKTALVAAERQQVLGIIPQIKLNQFNIVSNQSYWIPFYLKNFRKFLGVEQLSETEQARFDEAGKVLRQKLIVLEGARKKGEFTSRQTMLTTHIMQLISFVIKYRKGLPVRPLPEFETVFANAITILESLNNIRCLAWMKAFVLESSLLLRQIRAVFYVRAAYLKLCHEISSSLEKYFFGKVDSNFLTVNYRKDQLGPVTSTHLPILKLWYKDWKWGSNSADVKTLQILEESSELLLQIFQEKIKSNDRRGGIAMSAPSASAIPHEEKEIKAEAKDRDRIPVIQELIFDENGKPVEVFVPAAAPVQCASHAMSLFLPAASASSPVQNSSSAPYSSYAPATNSSSSLFARNLSPAFFAGSAASQIASIASEKEGMISAQRFSLPPESLEGKEAKRGIRT